MGTTPPITTNNPQNTRSTKPDQATGNWHEDYIRARHYSPNNNRTGPLRYKTLPAHPPSPHARYKTLPAHPPSPHARYKTLPAHQKWLDVALFLHAGRVLYRFAQHNTEQGEFCTERKAEIKRSDTTAHLAPPERMAPEEPEGQAAVQAAG